MTAATQRAGIVRPRRRSASARALWAALALLLVFARPAAAAANARVQMQVNPTRVTEGDAIQIEVTCSGDYDEIVPPTSDGFDLEQSGRSSQVSIMGSRVVRSERYSFVGTARRKGRHLIRGAKLRKAGSEVAIGQDAMVEVVDARASLGPALTPEEAASPNRYVGEPFFVRPSIAVLRPYVHQPFVLTYDLYWSRNQNVTALREIGEPNYGTLAVEDLLSGVKTQQQAVRFAGGAYTQQTTRKVLLTATRPGAHEILGPRYRVDVSNFFDSRAFKVGPPPIRIETRALPEQGRPASFAAGAVGALRIDGWLLERGRKTQQLALEPGERAVLAYQVRGTGNLYGLRALEPPMLQGMRIEALPGGGSSESVEMGPNGPEGSRTWQMTIAFDAPGTYTIPALEWAAFDPAEERYVTSSAGPFTIEVKGEAVAPAAADADAPEAPKPARRELRPIAAEARLAEVDPGTIADAGWLPLAAGLPWLLGLVFGFGLLLQRRRALRAPEARVAGALAVAEQALATARAEADYGAARAAVDAYLQTRIDLQSRGMTFAALADALHRAGAPAAPTTALVTQLEHCDYARFAPSEDRGADVGRTIDALQRALAEIDAGLGAPRAPSNRALGVLLLLGAAAGALCGPLPAHAGTLDAGFLAANEAYLAGELETARRGYEALLQHELPSPAVHYNLGNTLVRLGRLGEAVAHYRVAQRLGPDAALSVDLQQNLSLARERLAEDSRRRHRILHVFDESPELSVAIARAAPQSLLGWLLLLAAWIALPLVVLAARTRKRTFTLAAAAAIGVHVLATMWLVSARVTLRNAQTAIVVQSDTPLEACTGVGEPIDLPEGLEVRRLRTRPDGRAEVRLPNGRRGCVPATALYDVPSA